MPYVLDANGHRVVQALENSQYNWRTIDGIAHETGIDPRLVANILTFLPNAGIDVVQSSIPDKNGRALYTTRNHYIKSQSLANRLLSVFSDRIK